MTDEEIEREFEQWWGRLGKFDFERGYPRTREDAIRQGFIAGVKLALEKERA
jgi:hypothetical protein